MKLKKKDKRRNPKKYQRIKKQKVKLWSKKSELKKMRKEEKLI